jgi:hypothetical protein
MSKELNLEIIELKEVAPLITGITVAVATLLAVVITSVFNLKVARFNAEAQSKQKTRELTLERIEELFFLFDKWQLNLSIIYLNHLSCYNGKFSFNQVIELNSTQTLLAPGEAQKYKMIMTLHFPSLEIDYESVENSRSLLTPFLSNPSERKLTADDFEKSQIIFEKACDSFKLKVSALAQSTLSAPPKKMKKSPKII